jgi:hypothetical protein
MENELRKHKYAKLWFEKRRLRYGGKRELGVNEGIL